MNNDSKDKKPLTITENIRLNAPIALVVTVIIFFISITGYFVSYKDDVEHRLSRLEAQTSINTINIEENRNVVIDVKLILAELMTDVKWLRADREENKQ